MKKIVITRPLEQGKIFASNLIDNIEGLDDCNVILEPLLRIEQKLDVHIGGGGIDQYDGIIITSSNAIPVVKKNYEILNLPFYCVGEQTAGKLKQVGVANVCACAYTVSDLVKKIPDNEGRYLYLRGEDINFDVKDHLLKRSITVDEKICYEARAVDNFSPYFLKAFNENEVELVTFFSKRTADTFVRLLQQRQGIDAQKYVDVRKIHILCIAQPVLECFYTVFYEENITMSKTPDMAGMIEAIDNCLSIS